MERAKTFDQFIIQCCALDEPTLRVFLKEELINAGFKIQEDDYEGRRPGAYKTVHNMLAIRGEAPDICLVAHTDVCREHSSVNLKIGRKTDPIIKVVENSFHDKIRIIQDRTCRTQVGGDDRLGVAINTWIALNTGYDMGLLFTTDEEIGGQSADKVKFPELMDFEVLIQVDRGNRARQLVTSIGGHKLCDKKVAKRLLDIAKEIELPRTVVDGLFTDVKAIKRNGRCKNAVNMTCGYHNNHGNDEYIIISEAYDTLKYVGTIIKDYYLNEYEEETEECDEEKSYFEYDDWDNDPVKFYEQMARMGYFMGMD